MEKNHMFQKRFSLVLCLLMGASNTIFATQSLGSLVPDIATPKPIAQQVADYSTGETKIKNGIINLISKNKANLHLVQTLNIKDDLNICAIAETFGCQTLMGRWYLEEILAQPLTAQDRDAVLANRKQAIEFLVNNPDKKKEIEQFLSMVKKYEQDLIQLMSEYFKGKTCPELNQLALIKKESPWIYPMSEFLELNPTGRLVKTSVALISVPIDAGVAYWVATDDIFKFIYTPPVRAAVIGFCALGSCLNTYQLYQEYSTGSQKRVKMHALNQMIDIAEKIEALCSEHGINTEFKISAIQDPVGLELIRKLKSSRYQEKDTIFFITPLVHGLLYKIYQNEQYIAQLFASIAEMDMYNAIATKIIESKDKDNKFCLATFVETEQLHAPIRAKGFWNVLVKNPVVNSIVEDQNVILTGPNAGGKTTSIRAILQNIVFAQTLCIAAAEEFELSMFDMVEAYLNVSDDLINGDSLFKSEVKRAQNILAKIKSLEPNQKYFFALDELFTGTVAEDGEECAYQFVKRLSEFNNIQFIYATHFKRLKELGDDSATRCANYKVDAPTRNAEGTLVYPFTLSKGANTVNIGKEIAKDAGLFA
jgi:hypothetical protein